MPDHLSPIYLFHVAFWRWAKVREKKIDPREGGGAPGGRGLGGGPPKSSIVLFSVVRSYLLACIYIYYLSHGILKSFISLYFISSFILGLDYDSVGG